MISQEIQDNIFRGMSADKKLEIGAQFWQLGKSLAGKKILYANKRSAQAVGGRRESSK